MWDDVPLPVLQADLDQPKYLITPVNFHRLPYELLGRKSTSENWSG